MSLTPDPFSLGGRTILVVGATSGIGSACALACAARGARVVVSGRQQDELDALIDRLRQISSEEHTAIAGDVTEASVRNTLAGAAEFDGLAYAAGVLSLKPTVLLSEKDLAQHLAVNFQAPVMLTQAMLRGRRMRRGGSFVYISSIMASLGCGGHLAYSGSKGALSSMVRTLALELAPLEIRANCVCPAMVDSGMSHYTRETVPSDSLERHRAAYPLGFGNPDDIASPVIFLLSPASRWVTGINLTLDGGFSLQ